MTKTLNHKTIFKIVPKSTESKETTKSNKLEFKILIRHSFLGVPYWRNYKAFPSCTCRDSYSPKVKLLTHLAHIGASNKVKIIENY